MHARNTATLWAGDERMAFPTGPCLHLGDHSTFPVPDKSWDVAT